MTTSLGPALLAVLALVGPPATPGPAARRPFTVDDLLALERVGEPDLSPDGRTLAFVVTRAAPDGSKLLSSLWTVPADGGEPRRLTHGDERVRSPRFTPDGTGLAFVPEVLGWIERFLGEASAPTQALGADAPAASSPRP